MVNLNITSNDACKLGSLILAVDRGALIRVSGKILHEGKTIYVGKYSYDGREYEIDIWTYWIPMVKKQYVSVMNYGSTI